MSIFALGGYALFVGMLYWWYVLWRQLNFQLSTLLILNTLGTIFVLLGTWNLVSGMLLLPILLLYILGSGALILGYHKMHDSQK